MIMIFKWRSKDITHAYLTVNNNNYFFLTLFKQQAFLYFSTSCLTSNNFIPEKHNFWYALYLSCLYHIIFVLKLIPHTVSIISYMSVLLIRLCSSSFEIVLRMIWFYGYKAFESVYHTVLWFIFNGLYEHLEDIKWLSE